MDDVHFPEVYGRNVDDENYDACFTFYELFIDRNTTVEPYTIETSFASTVGDLELLQYLQDMPENPWQVQKCNTEDKRDLFYILNAIMLGYDNYKSFQWARRSRFPWNQWTFEVAMRKGLDLQTLKWLHKKGCPLSTDTFAIAASHRDLNVLQWLREIECPWSEWTFARAVRERRDWEVLIWLKAHRCPWDHDSLHFAMKNNDNLLLVKYLLEEKCATNEYTAKYAIETGNVTVLKLLGSAGYTFDEQQYDFYKAVSDKPLEILQALHSIGCPWDEDCFQRAVIRGDMEILRWLRAERCPWDESTFTSAINRGNLEIIRWLYEEKCPPSDKSAAFQALMEKHLQLAN
jgi:hypothetical protein